MTCLPQCTYWQAMGVHAPGCPVPSAMAPTSPSTNAAHDRKGKPDEGGTGEVASLSFQAPDAASPPIFEPLTPQIAARWLALIAVALITLAALAWVAGVWPT